MVRFSLSIMVSWPRNRHDLRQAVDQIYSASVLSLLVIAISSLFVGMVLSLQLAVIMEHFGSVDWVSKMVA